MRARLMAEEQVIAKSRDVERANSELNRANRDLEDYASIISHDLASPLRALRYMAAAAEMALGDNAPPAAVAKLAEMRRQSARMSGMLAALLDYASVGRKEEVAEEVDTAALIVAIAASIPRSSGLKVVIEGDWPKLSTLAAPLDVVLRNLLDNAIKHHDRVLGRITVHASNGATSLDITVADDGPGIDPAHQMAVFLPFRTLQTPDEQVVSDSSRGRGMGLALVARTLEAVGGHIALESEPNRRRGTTFRVRWPHAAGRPMAPLPTR
jgi:signal transduction histidine kinase